MKVVDASPWEKRNLGMNAWEITLDRADMADVPGTIAALNDSKFDNSYVCIKLPVGDLQMVHALEDDGFRFLETQLSLVDTFEPTAEISNSASLIGEIGTRVVPKERDAWEKVISRITPGMFDTDRISLDPELGESCACLRYQNWCRDLFENPNAQMLVTTLNGDDAAFSVRIAKSANDYDGILGAVFEEYKNSGLGAVMVADVKYRENGAKQKTVVSSNNLSVLRLHQNSGRTIYREMYVFRKIKK